MKGTHAKKKLGAVGAMPPNPLSLKTPGEGGGEGGLGGVAYKDRARPPPRDQAIGPGTVLTEVGVTRTQDGLQQRLTHSIRAYVRLCWRGSRGRQPRELWMKAMDSRAQDQDHPLKQALVLHTFSRRAACLAIVVF